MPINIVRGPAGNRSLVMGLVGHTTDFQSAVDQFIFTANTSAQVDTNNSDRVDILNDALTTTNGVDSFEVSGVHYTDLQYTDPVSGVVTFSSATEAVDYINDAVSFTYAALLGANTTPLHTPPTINVSLGVPFEYKVNIDHAIGYFWEEQTFPGGVGVSTYDARVIKGTPTLAGTFQLEVDVRNRAGITSSYVELVVS